MQPVKHNFKPLMIKKWFSIWTLFETQCAKAILVLTSSKTWQAAVYFAPKHKHPPSEVEKMQNLKRCRLQNQPKLLILLSIHIGSRLPLCLRKNEKGQKIVLFKVNFLDNFSHNDFYFFSNIILFVSVGHFSAGSSSVKIKATYWRIPIDPFWFTTRS